MVRALSSESAPCQTTSSGSPVQSSCAAALAASTARRSSWVIASKTSVRSHAVEPRAQRCTFLQAVAIPPGAKQRFLHRILGVRQRAEHAVTVEQQLAAMTLDVASELVHNVHRSTAADGSASILTCNTGAGSKTHRAVCIRSCPERLNGQVIAKWQLIPSECKRLCHSLLKENHLLHQGLSPMELPSATDRAVCQAQPSM